ncbi:MAG TPA: alkaline phosphatase family protein [Candidatus Enterocola sp.]|nr:alkaline phosphatase family protein [Candidatus Enterocola sp.]
MKYKIFACLASLLFFFNSVDAQTPSMPERPRIVVGITIDGLRSDYLSLFWNSLSKGGFKRLAEQGAVFPNVRYSYQSADASVDVASFATGAEPYIHGIVGDSKFDRKLSRQVKSASDASVIGLSDTRTLSAKNLQCTSLADELQEASINGSKIVSVGIDPTKAILQLGHVGNCFWMNNISGNWASSNYYMTSLPEWVQNINNKKTIDTYLSKTWETMYPAGYYVSASTNGGSGFKYEVRAACNGLHLYDNFATTPFANDYLCDFALEAIEQLKMGKDMIPDLMLLQFSAQPFFLKAEFGLSMELEDAYLRLDKNLQWLFENLDNKFGKDNVLIYLTTTRTDDAMKTTRMNPNVPGKSFNVDRYLALLNSYLMANYGQFKWVLSCGRGNIYLNRELIEEKGLNLKDVQNKAVEFFYLIPGVVNVATSFDLEQAYFASGSLRYAYYRESSGDLLYTLSPGWYEVDINNRPNGYKSNSSQTVPLYFYGWRIAPQLVSDQVDAADAVFTLSRWLRIPAPNGSKGVVLPVKLNDK